LRFIIPYRDDQPPPYSQYGQTNLTVTATELGNDTTDAAG
jgi:hypothetical protein